jgi:hypothetical protein
VENYRVWLHDLFAARGLRESPGGLGQSQDTFMQPKTGVEIPLANRDVVSEKLARYNHFWIK